MNHSLEMAMLLLLAACVTMATAQDDLCEEGWRPLDAKNANPFRCGKYFNDRKPYEDAMAYCGDNSPGRNGRLVMISDKATNRRLAELIRSDAGGPYLAWIGLRSVEVNEGGETERFFRWHNSRGRRLLDRSYKNWAPDSPNNDKARGGQECVYFNDYRAEGSWNDFECHALMQFVCQYEV